MSQQDAFTHFVKPLLGKFTMKGTEEQQQKNIEELCFDLSSYPVSILQAAEKELRRTRKWATFPTTADILKVMHEVKPSDPSDKLKWVKSQEITRDLVWVARWSKNWDILKRHHPSAQLMRSDVRGGQIGWHFPQNLMNELQLTYEDNEEIVGGKPLAKEDPEVRARIIAGFKKLQEVDG